MNIQHRETPAAGAGTVVGRIAEIWRYPVQSMGGECLTRTALSGGGVPGDREYGIVDPGIGEVVSGALGKKKWRGIVTLSARLLEAPAAGKLPAVEIVTPEGETLRGDQQNIDERLSAILGRPVHLAHRVSENKRSSYGHEPLHILTTASMAAFKSHHKSGQFTPARFRPNLVIDTGGASGFVEQAWLERILQIGDGVRITATDNCARCVMTTLAQGDLPFDPAILHTVTASNRSWAGIYAGMRAPGEISVGDPVTLL
ncbi:MAG: MOSC domain-containing protein [Dongiaceae bacterium]